MSRVQIPTVPLLPFTFTVTVDRERIEAMAKLSARGAHKVADVQFDIPMRDDDAGVDSDAVTDSYITVALRSDGHILERITFTYRNTSTGTYSNTGQYKDTGTLKDGVPITAETLERVARKRYGRRYWPRQGARSDWTTDNTRAAILFLMRALGTGTGGRLL